MAWYNNITDTEAMIQALDFNDRLMCELNDVLGEELNEEIHRDNMRGVKSV